MGFSLPRFLRLTPTESLREYLQARGLDATLDSVVWDSPPRDLTEQLRGIFDSLPTPDRDGVWSDFERVDQLGDEIGQTALRSIASPELLSRLSELDGDFARGLLVLVKDPTAFDQAMATAYMHRHWQGRSWGSFNLGGPVELWRDGDHLDTLKTELADCFRSNDGSGRRVIIDRFERLGFGFGDAPPADLQQFTVYVEGVPTTTVEFDEMNRLAPRVGRPVIEAAICCDPASGLVDIVSKGGRRLREKIAQAFAAHIVQGAVSPEPLRKRRLRLDRLKRPMEFNWNPEDGIKSVQVASLRLADFSAPQSRVTIEVGPLLDIHGACAGWWGMSDLLKNPGWRVTKARLRFTFNAEAPGRRDKTITVELTAPHGSNIKDQTRQHQVTCEKCLDRWGLVDSV